MKPPARPAALAHIYHWPGPRPALLDLDAEQNGDIIGLLFARRDDRCLLPVAWRYGRLDPDCDDLPHPLLPVEEDALDSEQLAHTKAQLEADGWQLQGRLDLFFTGRQVGPHFWHYLGNFLRDYQDRPYDAEEDSHGA